MNKPTFKESYDKIVQAYYKDEIEPGSNSFCFCGTLSPHEHWRSPSMHETINFPYSVPEYLRLETSLFYGMSKVIKREVSSNMSYYDFNLLKKHSSYEEALFKGMCAAVEELKKIHIERGENIDEQFLTKRKLHEQQ